MAQPPEVLSHHQDRAGWDEVDRIAKGILLTGGSRVVSALFELGVLNGKPRHAKAHTDYSMLCRLCWNSCDGLVAGFHARVTRNV